MFAQTTSAPNGARSMPTILKAALNWQILALVGMLIVLAVVFNVYSDGVFLTPRNLSALLRQASIIGIVASGVAILIVMSEIDLSIGSAVYLIGAVAATAETAWNLNVAEVVALAIVGGMAIGAWQGFWVSKVGVPSFIVTLAGLLAYRGVGLYFTDARTISPLSDAHVALSESFVPAMPSIAGGVLVGLIATWMLLRRASAQRRRGAPVAMSDGVLAIGLSWGAIALFLVIALGYRGTPTAILWTLLVGAALWFITARTVFGRNAYMIGANRHAAHLAGISVERNVFFGFVLMGALYGVAAILFTARLDASTPADATFMELDAIAAAVIGGVALSGGKGRIPAVIGGALLLTTIDNGMSVMGVSSFLQQIVKGVILLAAVALDVRSRRR